MPHHFYCVKLQPVYNDQSLIFFSPSLSYSLSTQLFISVFFVSAHLFMCKWYSQCKHVNVNLHNLFQSLINSPSHTKAPEYYTSRSVNTSCVVDIITLCNLIASLHASFNSLASAHLLFCPCIANFIISSTPRLFDDGPFHCQGFYLFIAKLLVQLVGKLTKCGGW